MSIYDTLNPEQKDAVLSTEGPLLILAGAGSGKTRSVTHRIAYLIEEKGVFPWNILAITFTNKAAQEMRERVDQLVGPSANDVWISTFHAMCSRILRRHIDMIGYEKNFTIYDTNDQKTLMKEVLKMLKIDTKQYPERMVLSEISNAKNECKSPADYREEAMGDYRMDKIAQIYELYQKRLRENNALDFDDLLVKTVELFRARADILDYYQERFRYIMVDEYQDTNTVQYYLIGLLAAKYRNLCVVGDDDQSIYKFRGANIYNILNFEKQFPDAKVIKLEQNYRSTSNVLGAANGVIANNEGRKAKKLWTENGKGELVHFKQYENEYEEAEGVAKYIAFLSMRGIAYQDMAILYRTNAQSRIFEEKLKQKNIPYAIVRGISFYDRKEIKDLMAYLKTIDSGMDDIAVKRIINVPKRGIGATTIARLEDFAIFNQMSFLDAIYMAAEIPGLGRAAAKLKKFSDMIDEFRQALKEQSLSELLETVLETTGYRLELEAEGTPDALSRLQDIEELSNDIIYYEDHAEQPSLSDFLAEKDMYTLNAGIDNLEDDNNKVLLMTLHNAKGLEYENVFMGGMEEGLFPGYNAMMAMDSSELEEERRLCYVGITRAKKRLYLSCAMRRMVRGQTQFFRPSRFIDEIPPEYIDIPERKPKLTGRSFREDSYSSYDDMDMGFERRGSYGSDSYGRGTFGNGSYASGSQGGSYGSNSYGTGSFAGSSYKNSSAANSYKLDDFKAKPMGELSYGVGDRVKHIKFGQGEVIEINKSGKDYEVSVNFDRVGKKKMFASFAKLKKLT